MATEGWLSESVLRELYAQLFTTSARSTERPGEFNAQWVTNTVCCIREDESEGLPKTSAICGRDGRRGARTGQVECAVCGRLDTGTDTVKQPPGELIGV